MNQKPGKLLIAGGGTGGHIFPGVAVAEEWKKRGGEVLFVGTPAGQETHLVPKAGFDLRLIKVGRLKGGGILQRLRTVVGLPVALIKAMRILLEYKPDVVFGIGGYASGPAVVAARLLFLPTAITDQNSQPGLTNRILGKLVRKVFISFEPARRFFSTSKVVYTGNPVRSQIQAVPFRIPTDAEFRIFVFGGSQGAVTVNDRFTQALELIRPMWSRLKITHQAGATDIERLKKFYIDCGLSACVDSFFDNMNDLYASAHLVICRSGAGTLTELALSGRPSILIPYPFAADDHQSANAKVFVDAHAGWMFDQMKFTARELADLLLHLIQNPNELSTAATNASQLAKPNAAREIVDGLMALS